MHITNYLKPYNHHNQLHEPSQFLTSSNGLEHGATLLARQDRGLTEDEVRAYLLHRVTPQRLELEATMEAVVGASCRQLGMLGQVVGNGGFFHG